METGLVEKTLQGSLRQPDFHEYLLVANPDKKVYNQVMMEKQEFYEQFGDKKALTTKPHITLAKFMAREIMEETIIRYMQTICSRQVAFNVMLNNYSGFPLHTIYIRIQNPQPFIEVIRELKVVHSYIDSCSCPPIKPLTSPHLSIASDLSEDVYLKAIMQYSQKPFYETFIVTQLFLLRGDNDFDSYRTLNVFHLKPSENNFFN